MVVAGVAEGHAGAGAEAGAAIVIRSPDDPVEAGMDWPRRSLICSTRATAESIIDASRSGGGPYRYAAIEATTSTPTITVRR